MFLEEIHLQPPMSTAPTFDAAFAHVREVFAFYRNSPAAAATSLELEDCTLDVARAGLMAGLSFAALCAELGRAAVESFPRDPAGATGIERSMRQWAAHVYEPRAAS